MMKMMLAMSKVVAEYLLAFCFALSLVTRAVKAKLEITFISAIITTHKKPLGDTLAGHCRQRTALALVSITMDFD